MSLPSPSSVEPRRPLQPTSPMSPRVSQTSPEQTTTSQRRSFSAGLERVVSRRRDTPAALRPLLERSRRGGEPCSRSVHGFCVRVSVLQKPDNEEFFGTTTSSTSSCPNPNTESSAFSSVKTPRARHDTGTGSFSIRAAAGVTHIMSRPVLAKIKLMISAGAAKPAPPVGPALGQHGLNIMEFCKAFNAKTADFIRTRQSPW